MPTCQPRYAPQLLLGESSLDDLRLHPMRRNGFVEEKGHLLFCCVVEVPHRSLHCLRNVSRSLYRYVSPTTSKCFSVALILLLRRHDFILIRFGVLSWRFNVCIVLRSFTLNWQCWIDWVGNRDVKLR